MRSQDRQGAEFSGLSRKLRKPKIRGNVQIPGKRDEPRRRQLDGLSAGQDCATDVGREMGETHGDRQITAPHAEPRCHGLDAVIVAFRISTIAF